MASGELLLETLVLSSFLQVLSSLPFQFFFLTSALVGNNYLTTGGLLGISYDISITKPPGVVQQLGLVWVTGEVIGSNLVLKLMQDGTMT